MALATLSIDLVAKLASFEFNMDRAATVAERNAKRIDQAFGAVTKLLGAAAVGFSARGLVDMISRSAEAVANYQDLAEKMGTTADMAASLKLAADLSGTGLDTVAAASVRLTANLAKTDDEGKGAGAALHALGISLDEFRKLDPTTQLETIANKMGEFRDGTAKTAVAVTLFGKAGADLLPFFNDLNDAGRGYVVLTADQIRRTDENTKSVARLRNEFEGLQQYIAAEATPALTALAEEAAKTAKHLLGIGDAGRDLASDNTVCDFAETAAIALSTVAESVLFVIKSVRALGGSFQVVAKDIELVNRFTPWTMTKKLFTGGYAGEGLKEQVEERNKILAEADARYADLWSYNSTALTDTLRKRFAEQRALANQAKDDATDTRPDLPFGGGDGSAADGGSAARKEQLSDTERYLDSLYKQIEATQNLSAADQLLQDIRSGRLKLDGEVSEAGLLSAAQALDAAKAQAEAEADIQRAAEEAAKTLEKKAGAAAALYEQMRTPLEKYEDDLRDLQDLLASGYLSPDTYARAAINLKNEYESAAEPASKLSEFALQAQRNIQDALGTTLKDTLKGNFDDILDNWGDLLLDMAAQAASAKIGEYLFGNGQSGSTGVASGIFDTIFSSLIGSADGNVFRSSGLHAYANSVVAQPTLFKFAAGAGLMGEAGPEAIMPLWRGADGKLGVRGAGGGDGQVNIVINNNANAQVSASAQRNGSGGFDIDVLVEQLDGSLAQRIGGGRSSTGSTLASVYGLTRAAR